MATQFSQANVVYALWLALARMPNARHWRPSILAKEIAKQFPAVPAPALQVFAAKLLRLYDTMPDINDIESAGLRPDEVIAACAFFGGPLAATAEWLREDQVRHDSRNLAAPNGQGGAQ